MTKPILYDKAGNRIPPGSFAIVCDVCGGRPESGRTLINIKTGKSRDYCIPCLVARA